MRISVIRYRGLPPPQPTGFDFGQQGGSLGREADNELSLPDPERHVSRVQAHIDFDGHGYGLVDLGTNPTLVDGQALVKGERRPLSGGEIITMGSYELLVESPAPDRVGAGAVAAAEDPFAVFAAARPAPRPEAVAPSDPFAPAAPTPSPAAHDELGLGQLSGSASIDELFGLADSKSDLFTDSSPLSAGQAPAQDGDPLALFGAAQLRGADAQVAPQRDDAPLLEQSLSLPPPPIRRSEAASVPEPSSAPEIRRGSPQQQGMVLSWEATGRVSQPAQPAAEQDGELLQGFLRGLGVELELPDGLTPALMEQVGLMLREATQGTLDLLKARAITKREVRAEATMIASRDNNPLKFSPDIAFALAQLLTSRSKGFMGAREAMRDAYDDLRAHQLGMMAGMRSALAGVLARFEPAGLEARVGEHSLLDRLQPSGRKARLWDLYGQHYAALAREAADDFNQLFGKAFLEAYELQVDQLQRGGRDEPTPSAREA